MADVIELFSRKKIYKTQELSQSNGALFAPVSFEEVRKRNHATKERLAKDRQKANQKVMRIYKLK